MIGWPRAGCWVIARGHSGSRKDHGEHLAYRWCDQLHPSKPIWALSASSASKLLDADYPAHAMEPSRPALCCRATLYLNITMWQWKSDRRCSECLLGH